MFDLMNMMGKMKDIQAKIAEAQSNLQKITVEGESGGGMVKVKVTGKKQLISVELDPSLMNAESKTIAQDLIVAAVNKANEEADVVAREEIKKSTEGLLPNIPGLDLGRLMGA